MRSSPRYRVLRMLASAAPGLLAAALVFMVVEALLPNLVLIAMGRTVGDIPAAVTSGLGSPSGTGCSCSSASPAACTPSRHCADRRRTH